MPHTPTPIAAATTAIRTSGAARRADAEAAGDPAVQHRRRAGRRPRRRRSRARAPGRARRTGRTAGRRRRSAPRPTRALIARRCPRVREARRSSASRSWNEREEDEPDGERPAGRLRRPRHRRVSATPRARIEPRDRVREHDVPDRGRAAGDRRRRARRSTSVAGTRPSRPAAARERSGNSADVQAHREQAVRELEEDERDLPGRHAAADAVGEREDDPQPDLIDRRRSRSRTTASRSDARDGRVAEVDAQTQALAAQERQQHERLEHDAGCRPGPEEHLRRRAELERRVADTMRANAMSVAVRRRRCSARARTSAARSARGRSAAPRRSPTRP